MSTGNEQEKSNTSSEIALMRQAMTQMVEGQKELKELLYEQIKDHEGRLRALERTTTELSARLTMWQIIQTTFTTVASAIATILGRMP